MSQVHSGTRRGLSVALAVVLLGGVAGCGGGKDTYPVQGKVKLRNGSPLPGGMVIFEPIDGKTSATGEIQPDGSFRLTTVRPEDGAAVGKYRVAIIPPRPADRRRPSPPLVHPRYTRPETSGLEFIVTTDSDQNRCTFILNRAEDD